ncbi:MAG: ATP phosphoribosyltransferase [Bacteroidota bacterium]
MSKLKVAIQKKGRLNEKSIRLLKESGINISNGTSSLRAEARNFPIEVLFLRDDDIPQYVEQQVADVGILGENEVFEKGKNVDIIEQLGFAHCRLSLAIPKSDEYPSLDYFNNKKIATSYPNILADFFKKNNISAEIEEISGSVEISPSIGISDAICDIVSTGSTLITNGLREVETVIKSQAVLVANKNLSEEKKEILDNLLFRIKAVQRSSEYKYILLNAPDKSIPTISDVLPGMKSPTVLPLAEKGWSSVHSVVKEDEFWEVIDQLKALGAEGILVLSIEKMII